MFNLIFEFLFILTINFTIMDTNKDIISDLEKEIISNNSNISSKKQKIRKVIIFFLLFFSILNLINFIILIIVLGVKDVFAWLRLIVSILELSLVILINKIFKAPKISKKTKIFLIISGCLFAIFCIFFIIICIFIFTGYNLNIDNNIQIEYLLVLGTKIENNQPGIILEKRLEKTVEFYNSHQNITLILSGGKTSDSDLSEAQVMKNYLLNHSDISESQIITEDDSMNTVENLKNILKIIGNDKKVGLCTSNSHMYRAYGLAKKLNFIYLYPLSAKGYFWTFYGDIMREFYCVIFEYFSGNMNLFNIL